MEWSKLLAHRRSIRKFNAEPVREEAIERLLEAALAAPSSHNSRSTRLLVVEDAAVIARMAEMRDSGSAFMAGAPLAIVVLGDTAKTDLWQVNGAIAATMLQLEAVEQGLGSCWVQVAGRPRVKSAPEGEQAADYLRTLLPIPEGCEPLCVVALGYSDFRPAPLPPSDDRARVIRLKNGD